MAESKRKSPSCDPGTTCSFNACPVAIAAALFSRRRHCDCCDCLWSSRAARVLYASLSVWNVRRRDGASASAFASAALQGTSLEALAPPSTTPPVIAPVVRSLRAPIRRSGAGRVGGEHRRGAEPWRFAEAHPAITRERPCACARAGVISPNSGSTDRGAHDMSSRVQPTAFIEGRVSERGRSGGRRREKMGVLWTLCLKSLYRFQAIFTETTPFGLYFLPCKKKRIKLDAEGSKTKQWIGAHGK